jgi:hypothetical protein
MMGSCNAMSMMKFAFSEEMACLASGFIALGLELG